MSTPVETGLTWDDLLAYGEDGVRRELIDGAMYVSPAAGYGHQHAVARLCARFMGYVETHGGSVAAGPNVWFSPTHTVEPDVAVLRADHLHRIDGLVVRGAPTLIVEVLSPSNRGYDLVKKRALYERFGVPEYWCLDLDHDRLQRYRLVDGRYGTPEMFERGDKVASAALPGLILDVGDLLGSPEPSGAPEPSGPS